MSKKQSRKNLEARHVPEVGILNERTEEEIWLLKKLSDGALNGMVGDERIFREYKNVYCGKYIIDGVPVLYKQNEPLKMLTLKKKDFIIAIREEEYFDSDEKKLEFLKKYGWLIDDDDVKKYSASHKE